MPDTIRESIMSALDARLKTITVLNGYASDAGDNVFDWREDPLQDDELDALEYRDISCETGPTETIRTCTSLALSPTWFKAALIFAKVVGQTSGQKV